jgi:hypothetical protein
LRTALAWTRSSYAFSAASDVSPVRTASNAVSAASMPVRIARWMPLSRAEFMKPAASPAMSAPGA